MLRAQDKSLPVLPDDSDIKISTLPCGIRMYYVPNSSSKGLYSMALVQKTDARLPESERSRLAGERFLKAGFRGLPVCDFLSSNGILPGEDGYIENTPATIYLLDSISSARGDAISDSTLLCLFRIAAEASADSLPSSAQALIVAGDLDYKALCTKAALLSLVCPRTVGELPQMQYAWKAPDKSEDNIRVIDGPVSKVVVEWRGPRTPDRYINTVLPSITAKMSGEFISVLTGRLYPLFRSKGLYVWIDSEYKGSETAWGDEVTSLSISCARPDAGKVQELLREELSRMFSSGVGEEEYCYYRDAYRFDRLRYAENPARGNSSLIGRCVSHFIFGASLATESQKMKFAYRHMPDSVETRLFNRYVRKMPFSGTMGEVPSSPLRNNTISRDSIRRVLSKYVPEPYQGKLPKDRTEYITSGRQWTYSNGLNVIYRKIAGGSFLSYCYAVKGGGKWADEDYLNCLDGVPSNTLMNYMKSCGIEMRIDITPSSVKFSGTVPDESFETLVNILAAISLQKENEKVFAPSTYKLFALSGPATYESVKDILAKYSGALGAGVSGANFPDIRDGYKAEDSGAGTEPGSVSSVFPFDLSSLNNATSKVARYVLRDALGYSLSGKGRCLTLSCGFESYPYEKFRIIVRMGKYPAEENVAEENCLAETPETIVRKCLERLARADSWLEDISVYRNMAKNEFLSRKDTPAYYVNAVVDRYVDHKDLFSQFEKDVDKVSAADLNSFFSAALENLGR